MSQIIEALEKYFRCVKLNMPRVVQNCANPPKIGLRSRGQLPSGEISVIFLLRYFTNTAITKEALPELHFGERLNFRQFPAIRQKMLTFLIAEFFRS